MAAEAAAAPAVDQEERRVVANDPIAELTALEESFTTTNNNLASIATAAVTDADANVEADAVVRESYDRDQLPNAVVVGTGQQDQGGHRNVTQPDIAGPEAYDSAAGDIFSRMREQALAAEQRLITPTAVPKLQKATSRVSLVITS